jgi:AcrR family transcriptional regulator
MPDIRLGVRSPLANQAVDAGSREKLLRAAAELFSEKGFRDVSVREIAAHAGVNPALVGYYFRGKQALFNQVYRTHAAPVAQERMRRLKAITHDGRIPSVEEVLEAWLLPWLEAEGDRGRRMRRLRLTASLSGVRWGKTKKAAPFMMRTHGAFIKVLQECLPYLSQKTLIWRLHFMVGAITFGIWFPEPLLGFSRGECNPNKVEETVAQILSYSVKGFCAPEPGGAQKKPKPPSDSHD